MWHQCFHFCNTFKPFVDVTSLVWASPCDGGFRVSVFTRQFHVCIWHVSTLGLNVLLNLGFGEVSCGNFNVFVLVTSLNSLIPVLLLQLWGFNGYSHLIWCCLTWNICPLRHHKGLISETVCLEAAATEGNASHFWSCRLLLEPAVGIFFHQVAERKQKHSFPRNLSH